VWYNDVPDEGLLVMEKDGIGMSIMDVFVDDIVEMVPMEGDLDLRAIIYEKRKKGKEQKEEQDVQNTKGPL
jgi:hypothetical protein